MVMHQKMNELPLPNKENYFHTTAGSRRWITEFIYLEGICRLCWIMDHCHSNLSRESRLNYEKEK